MSAGPLDVVAARVIRMVLAVGVLMGVGAQVSVAAPTLVGSTGLIKIPTASVLKDGELELGFSWIGGPRSYMRPSQTYSLPPNTNRMYYASMGILPGLEVSLDMAQVVGSVDPDAPGVANAIHRLSNAKYQLPLPRGWPSFALGVQDPFSVNGLTRGAIGQTNYGLTTYYGVMSEGFGPLTLHFGYGQSPLFIQGAFGGADYELGYGLDVQAEYDSQQVNAGVLWHPTSWFGLYAARLFPDDWSYGTALTWRL